MKRKRKGWLLIVTLLVGTMLLSGCGESATTEEQNVQESNTQVVQEERFIPIDYGTLERSAYTIFVDTTTKVMWIKVRDYEVHGSGAGVGIAFEPMIDSEGNPLLYEGESTTQK